MCQNRSRGLKYNDYIYFLFAVFLGHDQQCSRPIPSYILGSLLAVRGGPYVVVGIKPRSTACEGKCPSCSSIFPVLIFWRGGSYTQLCSGYSWQVLRRSGWVDGARN